MLLHGPIKKIINTNIFKKQNLIKNYDYNSLDIVNNEDNDEAITNLNDENNQIVTIFDEDYFAQRQTKSILRSISGNQPFWKPSGQPGVYAISFLIDASNNLYAIYRYGTSFAFLPINLTSIVYTGTCNYIGDSANSGYPSGNLYIGTRQDILSFNKLGGPINNFQYGNTFIETMNSTATIYAIASDSLGNIYIGGNFLIERPSIGGIPQLGIGGLAKWDGTSWSSVGNFFLNGRSAVYSIVIDGSFIYVGGYFNYINDVEQVPANQARSFAVWNGSYWTNGNVGVYDDFDLTGSIYTMKKYKNTLFIGGTISKVGNITTPILSTCRNIFQLSIPDTSGFGRVNGGLDSSVYSIDVDPAGNLYVGGNFVTAYQNTAITSNIRAYKIVRSTLNKNGTRTWSGLTTRVTVGGITRTFNGVGIKGSVYAVVINPRKTNEIWVSGNFTETYFGLTSNKKPIRNARLNGAFISSFRWQTDYRWYKQPFAVTNSGT